MLFGTERGTRVDSIILDDGFQHRQIARQCDIVVIDATRSPFEDALLPAGHLREPTESLNRAGVCIVTRSDIAGASATAAVSRRIAEVCSCPIAITRHLWGSVRVIENGVSKEELIEVLRGKRLTACCGIGNPSAFFEQVRSAGTVLIETMPLSDHDRFERATMERLLKLAKGSDGVILTEKDWVKVRRWGSMLEGCPVYCPMVELDMVAGEAAAWEKICQVFDRAATDETY